MHSITISSRYSFSFKYFDSCFYNYFYPVKYKEEIIQIAEDYDVDASLIASVANVESGYKQDAFSSKGAVGIMQLMPSTAQWLAEKIGAQYSEELLLNGEYNLRLGGYYLSFLIKTFEDENTAICAYNAGQGNVQNWLQNKEYSNDGKTLQKIPFSETEKYLKKVLKNQYYYKNRIN